MVTLLLFLLLQVPTEVIRYWEDYTETEKQQVFYSSTVPDIVRCVYQNSFYPSDDDKTEKVLEILSEKQNDDNLRALYFYLFNSTFIHSDGALSEMVSAYCFKMVLNNPDYALSYFQDHSNIMNWYSEMIGFDIGVQRNPDDCFDRFKTIISKRKDPTTKCFLHKVEEAIESCRE